MGVVRSREQFVHCGLRKFRHSKSSVYRWYTQLDRHRFVYDTYKPTKATRTRHGWVHMFITHRPTLTLQLHNFDLFRTCRTSSFCTVAWKLARFKLTRRIARSLGGSWASCSSDWRFVAFFQTSEAVKRASCRLSPVALKRTGCDVWQLECQASNVTASIQSDHLLH